MASIKVFSEEDGQKWEMLVKNSMHSDVHFLPGFMRVLGRHINATPHLFIYGSGKKYVLYPFFKRKTGFKEAGYVKDTYDTISLWYYGGYIFCGKITPVFFNGFLEAFSAYCKKQGIVSEFCRLNPYLDYGNPLHAIGLRPSGNIVGIDLSKNLDEILGSFSGSARREINNSFRDHIEIVCGNSNELVDTFFNIYTLSMERKKAKPFYFFPKDFFLGLRDYFKENFILITALKEGNILSSFLFLHENGIMYYMLSGRNNSKKIGLAVKRIVFEAVKLAKEKNARVLDLGGEYENGSLMAFKTHFSKKLFLRQDYRKIHDLTAYNRLCTLANLKMEELKYENSRFFPEYRLQ